MINNLEPDKRVLSINYVILIPFILLFLTTVIISSFLFNKTHTDSIESQVTLYQEMILKNTVLKLDHFMEKPHLMNSTLNKILRIDSGLYNDLPRMRQIIIEYLHVYSTIMAGGLGIESSGNFIAAGRHVNGGFDSAIHQKEISPAYYYYKLDERGLPAELILSRESYDVKARSWYQRAIESGTAAWSSIYTFASKREIGLTAVLPVYNEDQFSGVLQSAFSLSFINNFLDKIPMEGNHRIFVYDDTDYMVAASGNTRIIITDDNEKLQRVGLNEIEDPIINAAYKSGALDLSRAENETVPYVVDKEKYYLRTISYSGDYGLNWTIAVTDIREDFTSEFELVLRQNLMISVFAAIFFLIIGIVILRKLLLPIRAMSKAVKGFPKDYKIIDLNLEGPEEIRELSRGFHVMSRQINQMMKSLNSAVQEKTEELEESNDKVETLSGLVPICANCKKIRDDKGYWNNLETYIEDHSEALFSHSLCIECADKLYGDKGWYNKDKK